jgi:hypothetical protein
MEPIIITGYVILDSETNLYSGGSSPPRWGKKPKIWSNIGHLKNHLNLVLTCNMSHDLISKIHYIKIPSYYRNSNVYDLTGNIVNFDIHEYLLEKANWERTYSDWTNQIIDYE